MYLIIEYMYVHSYKFLYMGKINIHIDTHILNMETKINLKKKRIIVGFGA